MRSAQFDKATVIREKKYGKREKLICGKISLELYEDAISVIKNFEEYRTINDFIEEAVYEKVKLLKAVKSSEGC